MRVASLVPSSILVVGALAQSTFEPADFNVTQALLDKGVNISSIPQLEGLVERSSSSGCSIAVSTPAHANPHGPAVRTLTSTSRNVVQFFATSFWKQQIDQPE
jgi:hypothetical protein